MTGKSLLFISCGIFEEELRRLLRERGLDWNIVFLDRLLGLVREIAG